MGGGAVCAAKPRNRRALAMREAGPAAGEACRRHWLQAKNRDETFKAVLLRPGVIEAMVCLASRLVVTLGWGEGEGEGKFRYEDEN